MYRRTIVIKYYSIFLLLHWGESSYHDLDFVPAKELVKWHQIKISNVPKNIEFVSRQCLMICFFMKKIHVTVQLLSIDSRSIIVLSTWILSFSCTFVCFLVFYRKNYGWIKPMINSIIYSHTDFSWWTKWNYFAKRYQQWSIDCFGIFWICIRNENLVNYVAIRFYRK